MWELKASHRIEELGYLPEIISCSDPRPVVDQVNDRYAHGGGWYPMKPKKWILDRESMTLTYPVSEDEAAYCEPEVYEPYARTRVLSGEMVYVYAHSWVLIDRGGDDWEVSRMD